MDGVEIWRSWVYASPHFSIIRRLANYFSAVGSTTISGLLLGRSYDVVVASSPPLFIGLAGLALARLRGVPMLLDIRDIWPEVAVEAGEFKSDAAIVRWGERLERYLYRQATSISVVTEAKWHKLARKGVPENKLSIIPNGTDLELLNRPADPKLRERLELQDKFVVVYAGLMGVFQGLQIAVEAANLLKHHRSIQFLFVGDGVKRADLQRKAASYQLENITWLPPQSREAVPGILRACDLALVPLVNDQLVDAVPSKLLEAWGCSLPVILIAGGEARRLVEEAGGGVVVSPGEAQQLADAILKISEERDGLGAMSRRGHQYVATRFDRPRLARHMEQVLKTMVGKAL
jgi:glycosyltransferase involved in cell wall biosynthesis